MSPRLPTQGPVGPAGPFLCPRCVASALQPRGEELRCGRCEGTWSKPQPGAALGPRLGASLEPLRGAALEALPPLVKPPDDFDRFEYDVPLVNGLAVPVALLLGLAVNAAQLSRYLAEMLIVMPFHELGHAVVAWLGGHFALPLPFITFSVWDEKSFWVAFALAAILVAGLLLGLRERRRYLVALAGAGLVTQAVMTFLVPNATAMRLVTWSGCAGEILGSTFLLVSFHYRLPDRLRWDFWRYVALFFGAVVLTRALGRWHDVVGNVDYLPVGTALGGRDDDQGDMNKLLRWGWSARGIAATYLGLGYAGLLLLAGHYVVFLRRAFQRDATS